MPDELREPATRSHSWTGAVRRARAMLDAPTAVAIAAFMFAASLGLAGHIWPDWASEARPSVNALLGGHWSEFFRNAPPYGGSLLLRAPFLALTRIWDGGATAVYRAGALPCMAALGGLGLWLSAQLKRRGCGTEARIAAVVVCIASPLSVIAVQRGHPEELLGAALCAAGVLCAQRDRPIWAGLLVGMAMASKEWGILAAGPVLVALPRHRVRAIVAMAVTASGVLAPFVLVRAGGFVGQTEGVALHSGNIFNPWQLWWFLGSPALHGGRTGPAWLAGVGHTLPIAMMVPLSLLHAGYSRRDPARRSLDAMLLLALLLLLRCALDPWDIDYYAVPFLTALLAWEATSFDRLPYIAIAGACVAFLVLQGAQEMLGYQPDLLATLFTVVVVPAIGLIGYRLLARPAAPHTPRPASEERGRPLPRVGEVGGQLG